MLFALACLLAPLSAPGTTNPVILIGGLSGSVLEASINDRQPPIKGCKNDDKGNWWQAWFSATFALNNQCFDSDMQLHYDDVGMIRNASDVLVRAKEGLAGIEYISETPKIEYMHALIVELVSFGWRRTQTAEGNQSIFGFPYDWRVTGDPQATVPQLAALRSVIEDASAQHGGRPAHIVAHSLGVGLAQQLLNGAAGGGEAWKARFVRSATYLAPPLKGTPGALQAAVLGPQLGNWIPQSVPDLVVSIVRTFPSLALMMPNDRDFWSNFTSGAAFVEDAASGKHYGYDDIASFLNDLPGASALARAWPAVSANASVAPLGADPGVPTFCGYAVDSQTALRIRFEETGFVKQKILETTPGDGTVGRESMAWCKRWSQAKVTEYTLGKGAGAHVAVASDPTVVRDVVWWLQRLQQA